MYQDYSGRHAQVISVGAIFREDGLHGGPWALLFKQSDISTVADQELCKCPVAPVTGETDRPPFSL